MKQTNQKMIDPLNEVQKREVNTMIMDVVSQQHAAQQRELAESRTTLERMQFELKTTTEEHVTQQRLLNEKSVKDHEAMMEETRKAFGLTESTMLAHDFKLNEMTAAMKAFEAQRNDTGNQLYATFAALQTLFEKVEKQTGVSETHIADQLGVVEGRDRDGGKTRRRRGREARGRIRCQHEPNVQREHAAVEPDEVAERQSQREVVLG